MRVSTPAAIDEAAVEDFWQDGFLVIDRLVDAESLRELRDAYDELLERRTAADGDRWLGDVTRQIMHPSVNHPVFAANAALTAGIAVAARLLRVGRVEKAYEMLMFKPPRHPHDTPWHQDAGYWANPVQPAGTSTAVPDAQFWVALDDADERNGCMWFVPGMHHGALLPHHVVSGDPATDRRLIAITPGDHFDSSCALAAPIAAGGCTVHLPGTPHRTGPNLTGDRPRRAYIFNVGAPRFARAAQEFRPVQLAESRGQPFRAR